MGGPTVTPGWAAIGLSLGVLLVAATPAPAALPADFNPATGRIEVRPAAIDFLDRARIGNMRWSVWNGRRAVGLGNNGAVRVTLDRPRRCGARRIFTRTVAATRPGREAPDGERVMRSGGHGCAITLGSTSRILGDFANGDRGPRHFRLTAASRFPAAVRGDYTRVVWRGWTANVAHGRGLRNGVPVALVAGAVRACRGIHFGWTLAHRGLTVTERPGTPTARTHTVNLC